MNCVFCCVFTQSKYVDMFYLLLESLFLYGNLENTQILVYTSTPFMHRIKESRWYDERIVFAVNDTYHTIDQACKARLDLFQLPIAQYEKILYLDTDVLVKDSLDKVFEVCTQDLLYVLEEGRLDDPILADDWGGKTLFGAEIVHYADKRAFTSGILLFKNGEAIQTLFTNIRECMLRRPHAFRCYDQPYIVYEAFRSRLYDNQQLKAYVVNNDENTNSTRAIHHFPGGPGVYAHKMATMSRFLTRLNGRFVTGMKVYDAKTKPRASLIGLCVSYQYMDTFQFTLPVNQGHFEKLYVLTQEDDVQTIEFCRAYPNVEVLLYNFKAHGKLFDKYGALNVGQQRMYADYPDRWYLILDSDILLPNNLTDLLHRETLDDQCLYGAIRINVSKTSDLLDKANSISKNKDWVYNNLLWNGKPSMMGCFQLYKKQNIYHRSANDCGYADYQFGYDHFKVFCTLEGIAYFHLGETGVNWGGKKVAFTNDAQPALDYVCHKKWNPIYYNTQGQVVRYGNSKNIEEDVWTCSDQMRFDLYQFFKSTPHFNIAEIGAHKGYTTKILANLFSTVYAVDNSVEWTAVSKQYNKDMTNIEYVMLDIYKESWDRLPEHVDVCFIDAVHSYEGCKSDALRALKRFTKLQYMVFDDYGVWPGVKKIVDELLQSKILVFERFIGITDVPGPRGIVRNVKEGILCRVNRTHIRPVRMIL